MHLAMQTEQDTVDLGGDESDNAENSGNRLVGHAGLRFWTERDAVVLVAVRFVETSIINTVMSAIRCPNACTPGRHGAVRE